MYKPVLLLSTIANICFGSLGDRVIAILPNGLGGKPFFISLKVLPPSVLLYKPLELPPELKL